MRPRGHLKRAYQGLGWGLVVLGLLHMATTFRAFDALSGAALWFFGSGIAMSLTGVFNLLNVRYGHVAAGLRWSCIGTNISMTVFAAVAGVATQATAFQFAVILSFFGGATLLSLLSRNIAVPEPRA